MDKSPKTDEGLKHNMKIFIKNMVCPRCVMSVEQLLKELNLSYRVVQLGEVETNEQPDTKQLKTLGDALQKLGFELLSDPSAKMIEQVKRSLIQKVQEGINAHFSLQKYLTGIVFKDYSTISKLFSEVEGITIEQYFILQKIERAKELIIYNEQSLQDVSVELGYSSSQHLSSQFKRVTGMTPTQFKAIGPAMRKPIDGVKSE